MKKLLKELINDFEAAKTNFIGMGALQSTYFDKGLDKAIELVNLRIESDIDGNDGNSDSFGSEYVKTYISRLGVGNDKDINKELTNGVSVKSLSNQVFMEGATPYFITTVVFVKK